VWRVTSEDSSTDSGYQESAVNYTRWAPFQPNRDDERCVYLDSLRSYGWVHAECSDTYCPVCEVDLENSQ